MGAPRRYGGGYPHKKTPAHGGRFAGTLVGLLVQGNPALPHTRYHVSVAFKASLVGFGYGVYFGQAAACPNGVINVKALIGAGLPYFMRGQYTG